MFLNLFKITFLSFFVAQISIASETVLHQKQVTLPVTISPSTILLSGFGYVRPMVKILVPELAEVTFLNHRNPEADAPCMKTLQTRKPSDVIQDLNAVENIVLTITLTKFATINETDNTCYVSMVEHVTGKIRGFDFDHEVYQEMQAREVADCK